MVQSNDIEKLYPSFGISGNNSTQLSNFPKVFIQELIYNTKSKVATKSKVEPSFDSTSTRETMKDQQCDEVKSNLVRSKVDNLKGSLLCYEMT